MYEYKATIVRIIDGDTIVCTVDLGFFMDRREEGFRVGRIDAPEVTLRGSTTPEEKAAGLDLRGYLAGFLTGQEVTLRTGKDNGRGKYRWVAEVLFPASLIPPSSATTLEGREGAVFVEDGEMVNLSDFLVASGLAEYKEY